MKTQKWAIAAMGAVALVGATLTLSLNSNAQGGGAAETQGPPPPNQAGPRFPGGGGAAAPFGGPDAPAQFRQGGGQFGGGGGGGTAMDSDNSFLYIVQGNMLFKVAKADLKVLGSTPLMQMPQGQGAPGAGRFGPGQPGGGQRPPGAGQGGGVRPPAED